MADGGTGGGGAPGPPPGGTPGEVGEALREYGEVGEIDGDELAELFDHVEYPLPLLPVGRVVPPEAGEEAARAAAEEENLNAMAEEALALYAEAQSLEGSADAAERCLQAYERCVELMLVIASKADEDKVRALFLSKAEECQAKADELGSSATLLPVATPVAIAVAVAPGSAALRDVPAAAAEIVADGALYSADPPQDALEEQGRQALAEALALDEGGRPGEAKDMYLEAVDLLLRHLQHLQLREGAPADAGAHLDRLTGLVERGLGRIRDISAAEDASAAAAEAEAASRRYRSRPAAAAAPAPRRAPAAPDPPPPGRAPPPPEDGGGSGLTSAEKEVLRRSSVVNRRLFLPWLSDQTRERFSLAAPFRDPSGLLPLSEAQAARLAAWRRPREIFRRPFVVRDASPHSVAQDLVGDCSFVASLCVCAAHEQRFRRRLVTAALYPQDSGGRPVYNPSGKYIARLWVNGVARRVEIDDRLPVDAAGRLLCSAGRADGELWVPLLEKAYMKVNGGYDFPGSNSGIDLFSLTGWIPEAVHFAEDDPERLRRRRIAAARGAPAWDHLEGAERVWQRLRGAFAHGDCLITAATAPAAAEEQRSLGLVPAHAYAVLQVREACGLRMLQLKNPWASHPWLGRFRHGDEASWTPELRAALQYTPKVARKLHGSGIFWVTYEDLRAHFKAVHLNWNPALFRHRAVTHAAWPLGAPGPRDDAYCVGYNPQYSVCVAPSRSAGSVWLLLSRHVRAREGGDEELTGEGVDYVTLHLYDRRGGRRVFYPERPLVRGLYSSDPHSLVRLDVAPSAEEQRFTAVATQHLRSRDVDFTLGVYSTLPFALRHAPQLPRHRRRVAGEWTDRTGGGSMNDGGYGLNPQWALTLGGRAALHLQLEAPRDFSANVTLVRRDSNGGGADRSTGRVCYVTERGEAATSGPYRKGFCYAEADRLERGDYTIVVSTYRPGQMGPFVLTVASSEPLASLRALPEAA